MEESLQQEDQQRRRHATKRPADEPAGGASKQEGSNGIGGRPACFTHPNPPQPQSQQHPQQHQRDVGAEEEEDCNRVCGSAPSGNLMTSGSTSILIVIDSAEEVADEEHLGEEGTARVQSVTTKNAPVSQSLPMSSCPSLSSNRYHPRLHALLASLSSSSFTPLELPSLIIVDLDYTLWKGNVSDQLRPFTASNHPDHVHVRGVFCSSSWGGGRGGGRRGGPTLFRLFPQAREVLAALHGTGIITLAVASRAPNTQAAVHMLQLMKLHAFFLTSSSFSSSTSSSSSSPSVVVEEKGEEEGRKGDEGKGMSKEMLMHISAEGFGKAKHLREILRTAKAEAHQVLFFDDQMGNLQDARKLGCCAQAVTSTEGLSWTAVESGLRAYREQHAARKMMAKYFMNK